MNSALRVVRDIALMLARIVVGVVMLAHGWHRWNTAGIPEQVDLLNQGGVPYATSLIWLVIGFEIIGGILLVFGLGTPLIGLGLLTLNVGVIVLLKADGSFFVHEGGWEFNAVLAVFGLIFLAFGAGRTGLDSLFLRPSDEKGELIVEASEADRIEPQEF